MRGCVYRMKPILALSMLLLTACVPAGEIQTAIPSESPLATEIPSTATMEPCAYVEATEALPDVTAQIDQAIKQLQPDASGRAEAYGENCVYASNGQSTFSAMETDFYITINVKKLQDDNELGGWIVNTMKIIEALPPTSIAGPQAGFVEFTFKTRDNQEVLRVPIDKYKSLPPETQPADLIPVLFPNP